MNLPIGAIAGSTFHRANSRNRIYLRKTLSIQLALNRNSIVLFARGTEVGNEFFRVFFPTR